MADGLLSMPEVLGDWVREAAGTTSGHDWQVFAAEADQQGVPVTCRTLCSTAPTRWSWPPTARAWSSGTELDDGAVRCPAFPDRENEALEEELDGEEVDDSTASDQLGDGLAPCVRA